jgi:hypothetical protein
MWNFYYTRPPPENHPRAKNHWHNCFNPSFTLKIKRQMKKIAMILMLAVAGASGVAVAQNPKVVTSDKAGWHKIGETTVDFKKEREEVEIYGANRFAAIKFKVDKEPIDLVSAEIIYASGDSQNINFNLHIKAPGYSRETNLDGGERTVTKIIFVYKTLPNPNDKKAHVEIWGLKTNTDAKK